jgi:peroxiredoxin Q/BCP
MRTVDVTAPGSAGEGRGTTTSPQVLGQHGGGSPEKNTGMKSFAMWAMVALGAAAAPVGTAWAALDGGEKAPDFTAPAARAGRQFAFSLAESLAKGPVVLYFFPAAFSAGCSAEAHEFAEAIARFEALGATVVGVSTDDIETQVKFSMQACQGKFAVASDPAKTVIKSYGAVMTRMPGYADRVSYVIAPDRSIVYAYQSLNPSKHVENTLAALRDWATTHPR